MMSLKCRAHALLFKRKKNRFLFQQNRYRKFIRKESLKVNKEVMGLLEMKEESRSKGRIVGKGHTERYSWAWDMAQGRWLRV